MHWIRAVLMTIGRSFIKPLAAFAVTGPEPTGAGGADPGGGPVSEFRSVVQYV